MPLWPAVLAAGASLIGGSMADKGQRDANQKNIELSREQMAFQERMSSTAYQRSTRDLEAAGLNRILALGNPASSPSGAMATTKSETAGKADALKTGTSSALHARIANQQFKQLKSQTNNIDAQTAKTELETLLTSQQLSGAVALEQFYKNNPTMRLIKEFLPMIGMGGSAAAGFLGGKTISPSFTPGGGGGVNNPKPKRKR